MRNIADYVVLIGLVVLCETVGMTSGYLSRSGFGSWYETLQKPVFMPPGWLFRPVWIALYALMGVAAARAYAHAPSRRYVAWALVLFAVQLACNFMWSIVFFGWHQPGWALVNCAAMWVFIAATMCLFWRASSLAGWLMTPYLLWVSFALVLNASIWHLNR